jgi:hypothetical protein
MRPDSVNDGDGIVVQDAALAEGDQQALFFLAALFRVRDLTPG